jgi:FtsZ-interacting cell division protein ZipA
MSRSTSINQLPSINQVSQQDDEDNAIHEVLAEIQNEQDIQNGKAPPIDDDTVQQLPPQPIQQTMQSQQLQQAQQSQSNHAELIQQLQLLNANKQKELNDTNKSTSRFDMILLDFKKNIKLICLIIVSFLLLQNTKIQELLTSRFSEINIPHLNLLILSIVQVLIVIIGKNFV